MNKVTPFLMFNDQLEAAIELYTATFPSSEVRNVARTGKDGPISSAEFVVGGQLFMGYNGGPYFSFSEGVSLYVFGFSAHPAQRLPDLHEPRQEGAAAIISG